MRNSLLAAAVLCALIFQPNRGALKAEMTALVQEQPPDEEIQPPRHAQLPGAEKPPVVPEPAAKAAALVAGNLVGIVFFIVGIAGWIVLGVCTWILERGRLPATPS